MNANVPLSFILIGVAVGLALWLVYRWISALSLSAQRTREASVKLDADVVLLSQAVASASAALASATAATDKVREMLAPASEELKKHIAGVPALLQMVAKIGEAQLNIMQAQRAEQKERQQNPFGRPNAPVPPRDTTAANLEHDVTTIMRTEGITREEALMRLNGANADSVWAAGNSLFEGWNR